MYLTAHFTRLQTFLNYMCSGILVYYIVAIQESTYKNRDNLNKLRHHLVSAYNTKPPRASATETPSHMLIAPVLMPIKAGAPLIIVLAFENAMLGVSSEELAPYM